MYGLFHVTRSTQPAGPTGVLVQDVTCRGEYGQAGTMWTRRTEEGELDGREEDVHGAGGVSHCHAVHYYCACELRI